MFEHPSRLPLAFDRVQGKQEVQAVVFHGQRPLIQGAELNDLQAAIRGRHDRLGSLIAEDGNRVSHGFAVVDIDRRTVTLTAGEIYVSGDVFPVAEAVLSNIAMIGRVEIGVRLVTDYVTAEVNPSLRGLVPGSKAEGEDGAAREVASIHWATSTDGGLGEFFQVYLLQDGTVLDQTLPPVLDGFNQALAVYDRPNGNYIVSGHRVSNLGVNAGKRMFSIEEGEANIYGFKIMRDAALRFEEAQAWDVSAVPGETKPYAGGASQQITTDFFPIDTIGSVLLTKERTVSLTRGTLTGGIDGLPETSVIKIVKVVQGATTFPDTSYLRTGNGIDWSPAGPEPAVGSSYEATIQWRASVQPTAVTERGFIVSGGVAGGDIIYAYTWKLPRIDVLGIRPNGEPVYIKGVSAAINQVMPGVPSNVLALCEIRNNWLTDPSIHADGVRTGVQSFPWSELGRLRNKVDNLDRLAQQERLKSEVDRRDPGAKKNTFVDPFEDDSYRDAGAPQSGAVGNGVLQLAIVPTFFDTPLTRAVTLDWVEEELVSQLLKTACVKINPYANFIPLPGGLKLTPAVDIWTEPRTTWLSDITLEFQRGVSTRATQTSSTEVNRVDRQSQALPFLRQRDVAFEISGFFPGEQLQTLTFDDVNVKPAGVQTANAQGIVSGHFVIPPNIPAGTKTVRAAGNVTPASALFTGQGTLEIDVMRRVTTINTWTAPIWVDTGREREPYGSDPQAQIFRTPGLRQIVGVDFHVCALGDPANHLIVNQVSVENGWPTVNAQSEALVSMLSNTTGWKSARYGLPITTPSDRDHAFVIKTDDNEHSVSLAALGGFDEAEQRAVTQHPYPIGPRLDSVNARTWTAHQKEALTFRLVAARYPVTTKVVDLGTYDLVEASDLQVRAMIDLPSADCSVVFEIERTNGTIYRMQPFQVLQLPEYLTETIRLRAVLKGTATLSPILFAPVQLIAGKIATEATYICRAFSLTNAERVSAYLKVHLPAGSLMAMHYDKGDGAWTALPLSATEISPDPAWVERNHRVGGLAAQSQMRVKITLTGGPAARPEAADFGLGAM